MGEIVAGGISASYKNISNPMMVFLLVKFFLQNKCMMMTMTSYLSREQIVANGKTPNAMILKMF